MTLTGDLITGRPLIKNRDMKAELGTKDDFRLLSEDLLCFQYKFLFTMGVMQAIWVEVIVALIKLLLWPARFSAEYSTT